MDSSDIVDLDVLISPGEAADILEQYICAGCFFSARLVDRDTRKDDGHTFITLVFEKRSFVVRDWASLTVTVDDLHYRTHIHAVVSGMDWPGKWIDDVPKVLADYRVVLPPDGGSSAVP